jgi:diguanylate cyclase (GGDEF)-like protein
VKLRAHFLIVLTLIAAVGLAAMFVFTRTVMMSGFMALERDNHIRSVMRVVELMNESSHQLVLKVADIATWDETYRYIDDLNPEYIQSNFTENFPALGIDHMVLFGLDDKVRFGRGPETDDGAISPAPAELLELPKRSPEIFDWKRYDDERKFFMEIEGRIYLVAIRPVVNTELDMPIHGSLLYTRELDRGALDEYEHITQNTIGTRLLTAEQRQTPSHDGNGPNPPRVDQSHPDRIEGRLILNGWKNVPLFELAVESKRYMFGRGQRVMRVMLAGSAGLCVIITLIALLLVDRFIVRRVERVTRIIESTSSQHHTSTMELLRSSGSDEIDRVGDRIHQLHAEALRLADFDELTGVRNARFFKGALERHITAARRYRWKPGLILIDLDHFKAVNDTFGHLQGDAVLKAVGDLLQKRVRGSDIAGRYGGEEFAVLLADTDQKGAMAAAESLRTAIEGLVIPPISGFRTIRITASLGVTLIVAEGALPEDALMLCDKALYDAKAAGRNRSVFMSGSA